MNELTQMIAGHFLCDYPLQGDWLSKIKNHRLNPVPGESVWLVALAGHSLIHAVMVGMVTGSTFLMVCEFMVHFFTDYYKCEGTLSYNTDQYIHIGCKFLWFGLLWMMP